MYYNTFVGKFCLLISKATPHKDRLTALSPRSLCWRHPCRLLATLRQHPVVGAYLQIFRHFCPKLLEIRQYYFAVLDNLTENLPAYLPHNLCAVLP